MQWNPHKPPAMRSIVLAALAIGLLGAIPLITLPLLAGGLPAGFRDQVLRLATGHSPAAVAHRAAVAKTSYSFGHHGFPRPLHQPGPPWLHPRPAQMLMVGAGSGNDAAGGLRHAGVAEVTAVDIDPVIIDLGRRYHPARPSPSSDASPVRQKAHAISDATVNSRAATAPPSPPS